MTDICDGHPRRTSVTDIRDGHPRRTQGFSVASPKTSMASGKLPTRRICLSPVSAISTSKVAGLGRDSLLHVYSGGSASYTSPWPALIGEQSNTYPCWDLQHNPHIHLNTLTNPHYITYKRHKQYNINNSGNSHYNSISRRILLVLAPVSPRDKLPDHLVVTQTTEHPITVAQYYNVYSRHTVTLKYNHIKWTIVTYI